MIENGHFNLVNGTTTFGSIVEYSCAEDYWLEPQSRRRQMCLREGKWSAEAPTCDLITCGEPELPAGGYVVGYDFNVHSKIEFHCEPGYLLVGQSLLECTSQGEWNVNPPTCQCTKNPFHNLLKIVIVFEKLILFFLNYADIDCGKLPPLLYGSINYLNNTTHLDSEIIYSCTRNYRLVGSPVRKCLENQAWSGTAARCEGMYQKKSPMSFNRLILCNIL